MDSRETLALYTQGKEAWNAWAREMSARRDENDPQWEQAATDLFCSAHGGFRSGVSGL